MTLMTWGSNPEPDPPDHFVRDIVVAALLALCIALGAKLAFGGELPHLQPQAHCVLNPYPGVLMRCDGPAEPNATGPVWTPNAPHNPANTQGQKPWQRWDGEFGGHGWTEGDDCGVECRENWCFDFTQPDPDAHTPAKFRAFYCPPRGQR